MSEPKPEARRSFVDFIGLNQELTPEEAISRLAEFHHTTDDVILDHFAHLRDFQEGKVIFRESVNSGNSCIAMEGVGPDGRRKWYKLINMVTGRPQASAS